MRLEEIRTKIGIKCSGRHIWGSKKYAFEADRPKKYKKSPNCTKIRKKFVEISERKQFELWKICAIIVWL